MKRSIFKNRSLKFGLYGTVTAPPVTTAAPPPPPASSPAASATAAAPSTPPTPMEPLTTGKDIDVDVVDPGAEDTYAARDKTLNDVVKTLRDAPEGVEVGALPAEEKARTVALSELKQDPGWTYTGVEPSKEWGLQPDDKILSNGNLQKGWKVPDAQKDFFEFDGKFVVKKTPSQDMVKGYLEKAIPGFDDMPKAQQGMIHDHFLGVRDGSKPTRSVAEVMDTITAYSPQAWGGGKTLPLELMNPREALKERLGAGDVSDEALEQFDGLEPDDQWNIAYNAKGMTPEQLTNVLDTKTKIATATDTYKKKLEADPTTEEGVVSNGAEILNAFNARQNDLVNEMGDIKAKIDASPPPADEAKKDLYTQLADKYATYVDNENDLAKAAINANGKEIERITGVRPDFTNKGRETQRANAPLAQGKKEVEHFLANTFEPLKKLAGDVKSFATDMKTWIEGEDGAKDLDAGIKENFDKIFGENGLRSLVGSTFGRLEKKGGEGANTGTGEGGLFGSGVSELIRKPKEGSGRVAQFGDSFTDNMTENKKAEAEAEDAEQKTLGQELKNLLDTFRIRRRLGRGL